MFKIFPYTILQINSCIQKPRAEPGLHSMCCAGFVHRGVTRDQPSVNREQTDRHRQNAERGRNPRPPADRTSRPRLRLVRVDRQSGAERAEDARDDEDAPRDEHKLLRRVIEIRRERGHQVADGARDEQRDEEDIPTEPHVLPGLARFFRDARDTVDHNSLLLGV